MEDDVEARISIGVCQRQSTPKLKNMVVNICKSTFFSKKYKTTLTIHDEVSSLLFLFTGVGSRHPTSRLGGASQRG